MRADPDGVLINIGHKAEGIVPPAEMKTLTEEGRKPLNVGDDIVTYVIKGETSEQAAILSIDKAVGEKGWQVLQKAMDSGQLVKGKIQGFNRGGAIVDVEGVQGFVPMSQLVSVSRDNFRPPKESQEPTASGEPLGTQVAPEEPKEVEASEGKVAQDAPEEPKGGEASEGKAAQEAPEEPKEVEASETKAVQEAPEEPKGGEASESKAAPPTESPDLGKELELKVLELDRSRNRAIFSERRVVQELRERQKARLIEELTEGETRTGKVTGISSFGAFVDLGGADGLIHISELSWNPVKSPDEIVKVGDEVDVYVLRVDAENKKIALSLRRLQPEPWETINEVHQVGDIVDAQVTKLTNFGAFARVDGSVEGLIHISELTSRMINHPREVVEEGESVKLRILRIEPERRRLGLSLKQAEEEED